MARDRSTGSTNLREHERLARELQADLREARAAAGGGFVGVALERAEAKIVLLLNHGRDWETELNRQAELLEEATADLDEARAEIQSLREGRSVSWPAVSGPYDHQADGINGQEPRS